MGRLRGRIKGFVEAAARPLASLPGDVYTLLGLAASLAYLAAAAAGSPLLAVLLLAVSGLLDALDGAVARLRGEAGPRGAYLDSLLDRVEDTVYAAGFMELGYPAWAVLAFLTGALLTSYARARYESLAGGSMEGTGLLERSDRVVAQLLVLLVHAALGVGVAVYLYSLLAVLAWTTFAQRLVEGYRALPRTRAG
ncbi:CDP-alcohol phosphatidyltransferase family protein [Pyrodictium occultum]|nr:CDP-alcohol phosphatidyltransferase family protein [Pyrodictium occultum]